MAAADMSMRGIRSRLLAAHRGGYVGAAVVAVVTGAIATAALNSLLLASSSRRLSGAPHEAAGWNMLIDLAVSFNGIVVGMGVFSAVVLLSSVTRFALEPRVAELSLLSVVGMTRRDLLRLTSTELAVAVTGGATAGTVLGVPLAYGYVYAERAMGLAPSGLEPRILPAAMLLAWAVTAAAGMAGGLPPVLRVSGTRPLDTADQVRAARRQGRRRHVVSVVLVLLVVLLEVAPATTVPADVAMIVVIPLAASVVVLNGRLFLRLVAGVAGAVPGSRRRPRLLVALRNAASGGARALTATQAIVLVFSLVVPLAMIMATGRQGGQEERYRSVKAASITTLAGVPADGQLEQVAQRTGDGDITPYAIITDLVPAASPYTTDVLSVVATDLERLPSQLAVSAAEGDLRQVRGAAVASASARYDIGDTVDILRPDGTVFQATVTTRLDSNLYLQADIVLDYATNSESISQRSLARWFSSASAAEVKAAADAAGVAYDSVDSREDWIQEDLDRVVVDQRQTLVMIFLVPCLLAAAATLLGVRAYGKVTEPSRDRMRSLGFTRADLRREYLAEVGVQVGVIAVELAVTLGLAWLNVNRLVTSFGYDIAPTFDVPVSVSAGLVMLGVLLGAHCASSRRITGTITGTVTGTVTGIKEITHASV